MDILESLLLTISNLLFYPVIICLLIIAVQQCISLGRLVNELRQRISNNHLYVKSFNTNINAVKTEPLPTTQKLEMEYMLLLRKWEMAYSKSLSTDRLVVKAGPALGLMGTLIPMGTALASLSEGDMMAMSVNMVTAFTTTVVGMACGLSAFVIVHARTNWKRADTLSCEAICQQRMVDFSENQPSTSTQPATI
ncbi:MotA/TolQ/ExbB proton channel family protein [Flammeovirgaceae bacterium SG7u.111]|nr:MotA/TolQ/ExbB proton channel family protein [Flammeovirgaceae bacterium SG7u.132]WPO37773.1 MotA/TolQ/ExbB proton channel family protein [Flammeovirgaceae bacterium SG7u.111]